MLMAGKYARGARRELGVRGKRLRRLTVLVDKLMRHRHEGVRYSATKRQLSGLPSL